MDALRARNLRGISTGVALLATAVLAGAVALLTAGGQREARRAVPATATRPASLYVDRASRGGTCRDGRPVTAAASPRTPWCSLEWALTAAPAGRTVLVRAGNYPRLDISDSLRTPRVTLRAFPGERPQVAGLQAVGGGFVRLVGFRIRGQSLFDGARNVDLVGNELVRAGIQIMRPKDIHIEGNNFHDIPHHPDAPAPDGYALYVNSESTDPETCCDRTGLVVRGNRFNRVENDAIQLGGGANDVLVEANTFENLRPTFGAHGDAIQLVGVNRAVIRDNVIRNSNSGLMIVHSANRDVLIENNVISGAGWACDCGHMPGARFFNNTFWNNRYGGIVIADDQLGQHPPTRGLVIANNILQSLAVGAGGPLDKMAAFEDYNLIAAGERGGPHDMTTAPRFVDAAHDYYGLAAGSAGIDAGTSERGPARDQRGHPRVDDRTAPNSGGGGKTYVDLGAYERRAD